MKKFIQSIHFCGVFEDSDANAVGIIATKLSDENLNFKIFIDNTADAVSGTGDYAHRYTFEILLSQLTMMHDAKYLRSDELETKGKNVVSQIDWYVKHNLIEAVTVKFFSATSGEWWHSDSFLIDGSGDVIAEIEQKLSEEVL